jgi:hypothetical protein
MYDKVFSVIESCEFINVPKDYPARMLALLRLFGIYLSNQLKHMKIDFQLITWIDEILGLLPKLWGYLLKHDVIKRHFPYCTDQSCKINGGLPNALMYTAIVMDRLYILR